MSDTDSNTWIDLLWIQDLICSKDEVALTKLSQIVGRLVKSAADRLLIRFALRQGQYTDAVRHLLTLWYSYGKSRADLLQELRRVNLNVLADKIEDVRGEFGSEMQTILFGDPNRGRKHCYATAVSTSAPFTEAGYDEDVTGLLKGRKIDDNLIRAIARSMTLSSVLREKLDRLFKILLDRRDFRAIQARSARKDSNDVIKYSLQIWDSYGTRRKDLIEALRSVRLHGLAEEIIELLNGWTQDTNGGANAQLTQTTAKTPN